MKRNVILAIKGKQKYAEQDPEFIDLVTEGTMEFVDGGWNISYEESALTGLEGVTTSFRVEQRVVTLTRTGALNSQMVFEEGVVHESLYQMPFGALLLTVEAVSLIYDIVPDGGFIDLTYKIDIENTHCGTIDYHLDIRAK